MARDEVRLNEVNQGLGIISEDSGHVSSNLGNQCADCPDCTDCETDSDCPKDCSDKTD